MLEYGSEKVNKISPAAWDSEVKRYTPFDPANALDSDIVINYYVYISLYGDNVKQNSNFLIRTYADAYVVPRLSFGAYFNYTTLNRDEEIELFGNTIKKSGTSIWEIGGSIKPRFMLSDRFTLKPRFNIGHRQYNGENDFTTWKGLSLGASCELRYILSKQVDLFTETGFLFQPYGGNKETDVTFDPIFYLVFGIGL